MDAECTRLVNVLRSDNKQRANRTFLALWLGVSDRKLRKMIEQCQLEGVPIISIDKGYWLAENVDELRCYTIRERHRESAIDKKCTALENTEWFDK